MILDSTQGLVAAAIALGTAMTIISKLIDRIVPPKGTVPADVLQVIKTMEPKMHKIAHDVDNIQHVVVETREWHAPDKDGVQVWKMPGVKDELEKMNQKADTQIELLREIVRAFRDNPGHEEETTVD